MNSPSSAVTRRDLGPHWISPAESRVLYLELRGNLLGEEASVLKEIMYEHESIHGPYPFVANVRAMAGMDGKARRIFVHVDRPYPFAPCVIMGANFGIRTMIQGVVRAGRALLPQWFQWSLVIAANEDEMREVLRRDWNVNDEISMPHRGDESSSA